TRQAIEKAVESAPVVLFMKGTPEMPQCGFSRASIQILSLQGVDPAKFTAFNVLEDEELRQGGCSRGGGGGNSRNLYFVGISSSLVQLREGERRGLDIGTQNLYVNKDFIGGCDILVSMHQNGELAKLLEDAKVLATTSENTDGG
ncbi:hypothetical protein GP486_008200, partial [Trichoglossum hirsutum]